MLQVWTARSPSQVPEPGQEYAAFTTDATDRDGDADEVPAEPTPAAYGLPTR